MKKQFRRALISIIALLAVAAFTITWSLFMLPTSIREYRFRAALNEMAKQGETIVDLKTLMPEEWTLVCDSHGYDGDLYVPEFNRKYPPAAPPQDGFWGLTFIKASGEYIAVSGSCTRGGAMLTIDSCIRKEQSRLSLRKEQSACPEYWRK